MTPARRSTAAVVARAAVAAVALALGGTLSAGALAPAEGRSAPVAAPKQATSTASPLTVQLTTVPPVLPRKGRVVLAGTVTNDSEEDWSAVQADAFLGYGPITTRADLAAASAEPADANVGSRILDPGTFSSLGDLHPGDTAPFRISLPRSALPTSGPGVYWIGVHALGTDASGRDSVADGRARTFIPLLPKSGSTSASVVVPLRTTVRRTPDGRIMDPEQLLAQLAPDGVLGREVAFGASAGSRPVTWLVDPAVLDAAADLSAGNPPFTLGGSSSSSPSAGASSSSSGETSSDSGPNALSPEQRAVAQHWLAAAVGTLRQHTVLALPYADADVAAVARTRPGLLTEARRLSMASFAARQIGATPVVAPPGGYLGAKTLRKLPVDTVGLLSDHGLPRSRTAFRGPAGQPLILSDEAASTGGPGPTSAQAPLALRQRILSDAALRAMAGQQEPMVVTLPPGWDPGPEWWRAEFFSGLDQPWLTLTPATTGTGGLLGPYPERLRYPKGARRAEISRRNVASASRAHITGIVLGHLLDTKNNASDALTEAGLAAASYNARGDQEVARAQVDAINASARSKMAGVTVSTTDFVVLAGLDGTLTVSVANGLDEPVTVGIRSTTDPDLRIEVPKPVTIAAGQRTTVRLHAHATKIGVHRVRLTPVTTHGERLGSPLQFTMRISTVGRLISAILIIAGLVLFLAIVRRVVKRIREHRWKPPVDPAVGADA